MDDLAPTREAPHTTVAKLNIMANADGSGSPATEVDAPNVNIAAPPPVSVMVHVPGVSVKPVIEAIPVPWMFRNEEF